MLEVVIPEREFFNEETCEFITTESKVIRLEHSLVSISKWESTWCKPFLQCLEPNTKSPLTRKEFLDYIKCMTITQHVKDSTYYCLTKENLDDIVAYMNNPRSGTWFNDVNSSKQRSSREVVTSELVYYWMIAQGIPFDPCEKWHFNRLMNLVKICSIKNSGSNKMSSKDQAAYYRKLNADRKRKLGTKG